MADTFVKHGMVHEDHHFKTAEGKVQGSPPSKLKAMYDYLPTDAIATSDKHVPSKIVFSAEINALKVQAHCLGVYQIIPERLGPNGKAIYRHATADLVLMAATVNDEEGWVISKFSTLPNDRRCFQAACKGYPFGSTPWSSWNGRDWVEEPTVKCRPSYHGYGLEPLGVSHNTESSVSPPKGSSPSGKKRSGGSAPASPGGAGSPAK